jgi:hypothetical protein
MRRLFEALFLRRFAGDEDPLGNDAGIALANYLLFSY